MSEWHPILRIRRRLGRVKRRLLGRPEPTPWAPPPLFEWRANGALALNTPEPPMHAHNVLYNDAYFTQIDHLMRGRGFHLGPAGHVVNLVEYDRLLYVRDDDTGAYASLTFAPVFYPSQGWNIVFEPGRQTITQRCLEMEMQWSIEVPAGNDPVERWSVGLSNLRTAPRRISLFSHIVMKCDGTDLDANDIYRRADFEPDLGGIFVRQDAERHATIDLPRHNGFMVCAPRPTGWNANPGHFIGARRSLANPQAVEQGRLDGSRAVVYTPTLQLHVQLELRDTAAAHFLLGAASDLSDALRLRAQYLSVERQPDAAEAQPLPSPRFTLPDATLQAMLNTWVPLQIDMGLKWSRWGWKGYRDVLQQAMAAVLWDAPAVRKNLHEACAVQHTDGFGLRGWRPIDNRRYVDGHAWLILNVIEYLKETGDFNFLEEMAPFQEAAAVPAPVREHLARAAERLWADRGEHGLCLLFEGDWNDSLTVGRAGRGESVMVTMMFCRALRELAELARHEADAHASNEALRKFEALQSALRTHAWDGAWWRCAFSDAGEWIGSAERAEGKLFLVPQAWAQLAGVADDGHWASAWHAVETHLNTGWGLRLNWPSYTRGEPQYGRMSYVNPGHNENGSVYTHGSAFAIAALLERGQADRALRALHDVLPGHPARPVPCQPNVIFNGYYGPDSALLPGLADHAWFTGSAAWLYRSLLEQFLGLRRGYDGLCIAPVFPSAWERAGVVRKFRGTIYHVSILNPGRREAPPIAELLVDGKPWDAQAPLPITGESHQVVVRLAE